MSGYAHYKVLGCGKESSYEELKKNYRKLVLQHHPDKVDVQKAQTSDTFQQIEEAWTVLRNSDTRHKYDAECRQAQLESQSILVFATITVDEMEVTANDETLSYQCRCGSYYLADKEELKEKNSTMHIPCQECTFIIAIET